MRYLYSLQLSGRVDLDIHGSALSLSLPMAGAGADRGTPEAVEQPALPGDGALGVELHRIVSQESREERRESRRLSHMSGAPVVL